MELLKGRDLVPFTKPGNLLPTAKVISFVARITDSSKAMTGMAQLMFRIANESAPDIRGLNPGLSPAFVAFLERATAGSSSGAGDNADVDISL